MGWIFVILERIAEEMRYILATKRDNQGNYPDQNGALIPFDVK